MKALRTILCLLVTATLAYYSGYCRGVDKGQATTGPTAQQAKIAILGWMEATQLLTEANDALGQCLDRIHELEHQLQLKTQTEKQ